MYPPNFIDVLYRAYKQNPNVVHCTSANEIRFTKSGEIANYKKWKSKLEYGQGKKIFNLSGAGALYFPGCFHKDVCRDDIFMDICPTNDDMWFKCMNLLAGVDAKLLEQNCGFEKGGFVDHALPDFKYETLWSKNRRPQDGTTAQLKKIFKKYGLYKLFVNKSN